MKHTVILLILPLLLAGNVSGQSMPGPNWDPAAAAISADTGEARNTLDALYQLARRGEADELLALVRVIAEDTNQKGPERDYVLHSLALALADFEPGVIGPEVLEFLRETRSSVRIPHAENPAMGIPLFNIRAAATGSLAEWARLRNPPQEKDTTPLDVDAFIGSLPDLAGPGFAAHLRQARGVYDASELEAVLLAAPALPQVAAASVVVAELSPGLLGRPAVDDYLFDLLNHPQLGSTAALALGRHGDVSVLERLADLAATDAGLASRRASLALDAYLATGVEK